MTRKYKITISLIIILVCLVCVYVSSGGEARRHIRSLRSLDSKDIADYTIEVHPYGPRVPIPNGWLYVNDDRMKAAIFKSLADVKYEGKRDYITPLDPKDDPCSILITNANNGNDDFHIIVSKNAQRNVVRYGIMEISITGAEELPQILESFFATMNSEKGLVAE